MEQLKALVIDGKSKDVEARVQELLGRGITAEVLMNQALVPAMDVVGSRFQSGEFFLPEMLVAARAMQHGLKVLKPILSKGDSVSAGKAVIGTVKGDLHDIGKNLVIMSLEGAGFEVIDLGTDVASEKFVAAVTEHKPKILGLSALLTTTMLVMKDVLQALKTAGVRDSVKVLVGGAPITQQFATEIGADFYGPDSISAKDYARTV